MNHTSRIGEPNTPLYIRHLLPAYLPRLARMILRKDEVDLEIGHVFVATGRDADGAFIFHITDVGAGTLYRSAPYGEAVEMAHDLVTVLLEGLPEDE